MNVCSSILWSDKNKSPCSTFETPHVIASLGVLLRLRALRPMKYDPTGGQQNSSHQKWDLSFLSIVCCITIIMKKHMLLEKSN